MKRLWMAICDYIIVSYFIHLINEIIDGYKEAEKEKKKKKDSEQIEFEKAMNTLRKEEQKKIAKVVKTKTENKMEFGFH